MGKTTIWEFELCGKTVTVSCERKGNKYILYLGDDHLTNVYRVNAKKMRYGLEEEITIGSERCMFVVLDETPDLVVKGRMVKRDVDYAAFKEKRRSGMERLYTLIAVLGVVLLASVMMYAYLAPLTLEILEGWISVLIASFWMISVGLFHRGKWIEQIP